MGKAIAYPSSAQVSCWERVLATSYPDHLVEAVLARRAAQTGWAGALALMGTVDPPGGDLSVVLESYSTWLTAVWVLVEDVMPAHVDLLFPALVCLQPVLTLANAEAILAGFPRFLAAAGAYWEADGGDTFAQGLLTGYVYLVRHGVSATGVEFDPSF